MQLVRNVRLCLCLSAVWGAPAAASVQIHSITPSAASPQPLGTAITWNVLAQDSHPGPLTFQFSVAAPGQPLSMIKDFNVGYAGSSFWSAQPFVWVPVWVEGSYQIQVVAKDFTSGESISQTVTYQINPRASGGQPAVTATANPLVALFSAPACAAGSTMQIAFQQQGSTASAIFTNSQPCHPPTTMNFEVAGMYPSTTYLMHSVTNTGGTLKYGPNLTFTTGAVSSKVPIAPVTVVTGAGPQTDTAESLLMLNPIQFGTGPIYATMATDLSGKLLWYYYTTPAQSIVLTRPLANETMLTIQSGPAWNTASDNQQYLRLIDLAGNLIRETNTGVIQQELLALGATNGGPCTAISKPAPVGSACLDGFHHDAIQLPNGYTAVLVSIEKILPPGTQGDTSNLPVDVVGDMVLVLNTNWQVVWYFDAFQHDSGAPQLDINRAAVLGETCAPKQQGCPLMGLMGPGIAPQGKDWLHCNSLYYWPQDKDIILSSRNQDWVMKIDYNNGAGTANVKWRLGPCGDFTFNNTYHDSWPWNSGQHDVGIENGGAGPMTLFDNGATRVSPPSGSGASSGCMPGLGYGHSRGMALSITESSMQVSPVMSQDLGYFSDADGSAQLLSNGNYFFVAATVLVKQNTGLGGSQSYSEEYQPTSGTDTGTQVLNLNDTDVYRGWRLPNLYAPPTT